MDNISDKIMVDNIEEKSYIWKVHPAVENLNKTIFVVVIVILSGFVSAVFMEDLIFGVLAVLVLFLGLSSYFFPTEYGVNEKGVVKKIIGQKIAKPWSHFKRILILDDGVFLGTFKKPSRLDKYRGFFLPTKDKQIIEFIKSKVE